MKTHLELYLETLYEYLEKIQTEQDTERPFIHGYINGLKSAINMAEMTIKFEQNDKQIK